MDRRTINPDGLIDSTGIGYSQAIVQNGTLFMSGQVGWDADFELAGDDIESQTRRAFENVEVILDEVGKELGDLAKVTSYLVDPHARLEEYLEVWNEIFEGKPRPCHTILGVEQLARERFLVEVEAELAMDD